jgi:hypothetical protein
MTAQRRHGGSGLLLGKATNKLRNSYLLLKSCYLLVIRTSTASSIPIEGQGYRIDLDSKTACAASTNYCRILMSCVTLVSRTSKLYCNTLEKRGGRHGGNAHAPPSMAHPSTRSQPTYWQPTQCTPGLLR